LDCRAANHDAINQVANAGSRSGAVGGQLSDGVSDERFDIGGGNADDWGVFTFYMWVGSLPLNRALQSVLLALWITFFLLGAADLFGIPLLHTAGGYVGLITAVPAFYLAAAEIINETHGREVLPIGAPPPKAG